LHEQLKAFYSDIGRPSVDPELMIRMLLVGYCYGIRHERRPLEASNIDGDTLEIHGTRVRLWGADAPESSQLCGGEDRLAYRCGCSRIAVPGVPTAIRAEMTAREGRSGRPATFARIQLVRAKTFLRACGKRRTGLS
jgi:hypothetical protein